MQLSDLLPAALAALSQDLGPVLLGGHVKNKNGAGARPDDASSTVGGMAAVAAGATQPVGVRTEKMGGAAVVSEQNGAAHTSGAVGGHEDVASRAAFLRSAAEGLLLQGLSAVLGLAPEEEETPDGAKRCCGAGGPGVAGSTPAGGECDGSGCGKEGCKQGGTQPGSAGSENAMNGTCGEGAGPAIRLANGETSNGGHSTKVSCNAGSQLQPTAAAAQPKNSTPDAQDAQQERWARLAAAKLPLPRVVCGRQQLQEPTPELRPMTEAQPKTGAALQVSLYVWCLCACLPSALRNGRALTRTVFDPAWLASSTAAFESCAVFAACAPQRA